MLDRYTSEGTWSTLSNRAHHLSRGVSSDKYFTYTQDPGRCPRLSSRREFRIHPSQLTHVFTRYLLYRHNWPGRQVVRQSCCLSLTNISNASQTMHSSCSPDTRTILSNTPRIVQQYTQDNTNQHRSSTAAFNTSCASLLSLAFFTLLSARFASRRRRASSLSMNGYPPFLSPPNSRQF